MNNITLGPWSWEYHPDVKEPVALVANERDVLLATGDDGRSWIEISAEDARLIAAAPDLLGACMAIMDVRDDDPDTYHDAMVAIGAAVEKALGGKS